ncbi:hypothetical protein OS493_000745 [Desmophyllum pertusum]|uniref:Uncharacterized protein n=1 Tax=Desmophyllum pertusum TaxID=174260 RepID=A0A9X0A7L4_9CNID|nr:hypothetical protein OS493_000745 [Desmophyllum pertusum]
MYGKDTDQGGFFFNLTHKCACPDACLISPSEHTTNDPTVTAAPSDITITVVEIAVPAGMVVLILVFIVIWLVRRGQDNDRYHNIDGENGGAGVEQSDNEFPGTSTSEGTSGRGSVSVSQLSPIGSSCGRHHSA